MEDNPYACMANFLLFFLSFTGWGLCELVGLTFTRHEEEDDVLLLT